MIDCLDGMVVSWKIGTRPDAELVNTMLDATIETVTARQRTAGSTFPIEAPTTAGLDGCYGSLMQGLSARVS